MGFLCVFIIITGLICYGETSSMRVYEDTCSCGTRNYDDKTALIIGGIPVSDMRKYPWLVSVDNEQQKDSPWGGCSGALLSPTYVLTAAHCTELMTVPLKDIQIGLKGTNLKKPSKILKVKNKILHPDFSLDPPLHDVVLFELQTAVSCTEYNRPICLPDKSKFEESDEAIITGWGRTNVEGEGAEVLQEARVKIVSNENCNKTSMNSNKDPVDIANIICTSDEKNQTSCFGDSGSPLQVIQKDKAYVIGITSYGLSPDCRGLTVYINVAKYLSFIKKNVKDLPAA